MDREKLKYTITETFRLKGWWYFTWRILAVVALVWFFFPEMAINPASKENASESEQAEPFVAKAWHQTAETKRDLRAILTTTQSSFYWDSFNWMMEYGKASQPKDFESKILSLLMVMGETAVNEKQQQCRQFREKLMVVGQVNTRTGIACKRGVADWCKQVAGEKMHCRDKQPTGLDALTGDALGSHNLDTKLKRGLHSLPSF
ncbi:MAG: hypothetical protein P8P30_04915 [Rickettsiales bacterium]|nr:hypothetical protein [Rickettsiales bacterium]